MLLARHIKLFGFIASYQTQETRPEDPVNIKAAERMGKLHDQLMVASYDGHDLEVMLVRLLFCMFPDDTGNFQPAQSFEEWIDTRSNENGSDLGSLLEACALDWSGISPAIFGALFQSIMDPSARRNLGAHYTSESNILKLIRPLFLDRLRAEFERVKGNRNKMSAKLIFHGDLPPEPASFVDTVSDLFQTPFFDLLGQFLAHSGKGPGYVQTVLDVPLLDARGLHDALT